MGEPSEYLPVPSGSFPAAAHAPEPHCALPASAHAQVNVSAAPALRITADPIEMLHFHSSLPQRTNVTFSSPTLGRLQAEGVLPPGRLHLAVGANRWLWLQVHRTASGRFAAGDGRGRATLELDDGANGLRSARRTPWLDGRCESVGRLYRAQLRLPSDSAYVVWCASISTDVARHAK